MQVAMVIPATTSKARGATPAVVVAVVVVDVVVAAVVAVTAGALEETADP